MKLAKTLAGLMLAASFVAGPAAAQDYPSKPVNYIIPFNAGGESDIAARLQQPVWEKLTGQSLVIQYMAGAGGAQAWSQLNGMEGDGYTIMGTNLPHIVLQPMAQDVGYKTDDISNVYFFQYTPDAIVVPKDSQFKTLQDLIDYAKQNPGVVTVSGSGTNSANDVAQTRFNNLAGVNTTYIPFSGTSPATAAVLGSQVMAGFSYTTAAIAQGDQMRVLAVAADERVPSFPDVPTFKELGYDMVGGAYRGVAVPKSTPEDVKKQLSDVLDKINHDEGFIKKMEDGGFVVINVPYDKVPDFMAKRQEEYQAVAEKMGIAKK
ncbi:tripartite tricarboxylate transporter substrate binding protein [Aurantimonas sp. VKM B-3413]|uniref:Bug family tripartite tricarboxylate transporter substrate binding protein n=1 Tax=Aurantimonas sp. VKM B-3413 TaxID=2779401 RepID=UPI001E3453F5|nr:tripartite tricarboxylate transporter substrate binding protein [Aurantimonas sp. VKM B-3413]MCB8838153.1 tripartite tricarboxylate transporter substrate binding protein [Aurantimonas sp. VKM B-3413]